MKLLLFSLLAIQAACYSQEKTMSVDKFTGDTTYTTSVVKIGLLTDGGVNAELLTLKFNILSQNLDGKPVMMFVFTFKPFFTGYIPPKSKLFLKLTTGELITVGTYAKSDIFTSTDADVRVPIAPSVSQIKKLQKVAINAVRIETSNFNLDYTISQDGQKLISKSISLFPYK